MVFCNFTLEKSCSIISATVGYFTGGEDQYIITSSGKSLGLWIFENNKIERKTIVDVFGVIHSIVSFRPSGKLKDYLLVASDSGKIVILKYKKKKNIFRKVFESLLNFGNLSNIPTAGCSRFSVGHYLAVDPTGHAFIAGSLECYKYICNLSLVESKVPGKKSGIHISKPLDVSTKDTVTYDLVATGLKSEKPLFAVLEKKYVTLSPDEGIAEIPKQSLIFYELNKEQNSCTKLEEGSLDVEGNLLMSVPDDPGVFVCAKSFLVYKKFGSPVIQCPIPRRVTGIQTSKKRDLMIVCATTFKRDDQPFFLIQTEEGDLFKVILGKENGQVTTIQLEYFDTVPLATALCILKPSFLLLCAEFGNHLLYEIVGDNTVFSSSTGIDNCSFSPRQSLQNLRPLEEIRSLSPIMHVETAQCLLEDKTRLLVACGGSRPTFRIFEKGNQFSIPLKYTPRKLKKIPKSNKIVIIETNHNCYTPDTIEAKRKESTMNNPQQDSITESSSPKAEEPKQALFDPVPEEPGMWASAIRIVDYVERKQLFLHHLKQNEAAFSLCLLAKKELLFLLVGVAKDLKIGSSSSGSGAIMVYQVLESNALVKKFETYVEQCPLVMQKYREYLLTGIGGELRLYNLEDGKLQLISKKEDLCRKITSIHTCKDHVVVGDDRDGFFHLSFSSTTKKFEVFAVDGEPFRLKTSILINPTMLIAADKFGNMLIIELPERDRNKRLSSCQLVQEIKQEIKGTIVGSFYLGETVTSLKTCTFSTGKPVLIMYTTLSGTIGVLAPTVLSFGNNSTNNLSHFEMLMRQCNPTLCGGDHLFFRSYYYKSTNIIDGDLLEQFSNLDAKKKEMISEAFQSQPQYIEKQIRDLRESFVGNFSNNNVIHECASRIEIPKIAPEVVPIPPNLNDAIESPLK